MAFLTLIFYVIQIFCSKNIKSINFGLKKNWGPKKLSFQNNPSFCSGNCDECHATWDYLKQFLKFFLKLLRNILESILKLPWNIFENPLETTFKLNWKALETSLKHIWYTLEKPLKIKWNYCDATPLKLPWYTLQTILKRPWNCTETPLNLP